MPWKARGRTVSIGRHLTDAKAHAHDAGARKVISRARKDRT